MILQKKDDFPEKSSLGSDIPWLDRGGGRLVSVEMNKYSSSRGDGKCWTLEVDIGQKYLGMSRGSPEKNLLTGKKGGGGERRSRS